MLKTSLVLTAIGALVIGAAERAAAAISCTAAPDNKSVTVTITNPDPFAKFCNVNCQFDLPVGSVSHKLLKGGAAQRQGLGVLRAIDQRAEAHLVQGPRGLQEAIGAPRQ